MCKLKVTCACADTAYGMCIGKVRIFAASTSAFSHFEGLHIRTFVFYRRPSTAIIETTSSDNNSSTTRQESHYQTCQLTCLKRVGQNPYKTQGKLHNRYTVVRLITTKMAKYG